MANCNSCSAPLPANTQYCRYCGVRNDVDLHGKHNYQIVNQQSSRICPECGIKLQTITLDFESPLHIERCTECFGLFFDPGEIDLLLNRAISPVFAVNPELLGNINQARYRKDRAIKYLKCPVCQTLMNRVLFGHRSGVVIDQCKNHGVWLEGGEISHLLEWKKAGGQLLHNQKMAERQRQKSRQATQVKAEIDTLMQQHGTQDARINVLEAIASVVFTLFE